MKCPYLQELWLEKHTYIHINLKIFLLSQFRICLDSATLKINKSPRTAGLMNLTPLLSVSSGPALCRSLVAFPFPAVLVRWKASQTPLQLGQPLLKGCPTASAHQYLLRGRANPRVPSSHLVGPNMGGVFTHSGVG